MADRHLHAIVADIFDALDGIENAVKGKSFEEFKADWLLRHGVQRGIEIISEATRHLPDELLQPDFDVPWKQVRGIGNVLRHEYHRVADAIIWTVVTEHLPSLRAAVERIRSSPDFREP